MCTQSQITLLINPAAYILQFVFSSYTTLQDCQSDSLLYFYVCISPLAWYISWFHFIIGSTSYIFLNSLSPYFYYSLPHIPLTRSIFLHIIFFIFAFLCIEQRSTACLERHTCIFDDIRRAALVYPLSFNCYGHQEIYARADKIWNHNNSLWHIVDGYCSTTDKLYGSH